MKVTNVNSNQKNKNTKKVQKEKKPINKNIIKIKQINFNGSELVKQALCGF